ncbi:hypothetical protein CAL7716_101250 (plasmid) [Calothrix sp. PCC 7716]|nr:hypothetical protein CAL7716_101250 [Calothrix sp. PCC 7716]
MSAKENQETPKEDTFLDKQKKRIPFDFTKTSRERLLLLIPDWGNTLTRVLQNLVAFAVDAIEYARGRNKSFVPDSKLSELFNYYERLGEEIVFTAQIMNLPEPIPGNIPGWVVDVAYASLKDKSLSPTAPQVNLKDILDKMALGDALIDYCERRSIELNINPSNAKTIVKNIISRDKFAIIGRQLVEYCESIDIEAPTPDNFSDWSKRNINDPNHSDCHELLDILLNMKQLLPPEEMELLANRFKVRTKQLYEMYYRLNGRSSESNQIEGKRSENSNLNTCS